MHSLMNLTDSDVEVLVVALQSYADELNAEEPHAQVATRLRALLLEALALPLKA